MMYPPIFAAVADDADVTALLGTSPVRFYRFGNAPQNVEHPYVVHQLISGTPYNIVNGRPCGDRYTIQIDIYADSQDDVDSVSEAVRNALELKCNVTNYEINLREEDTKLWRTGLQVDWIVNR